MEEVAPSLCTNNTQLISISALFMHEHDNSVIVVFQTVNVKICADWGGHDAHRRLIAVENPVVRAAMEQRYC
jgi:hypothetical protein